jgi:hypothetical protein
MHDRDCRLTALDESFLLRVRPSEVTGAAPWVFKYRFSGQIRVLHMGCTPILARSLTVDREQTANLTEL